MKKILFGLIVVLGLLGCGEQKDAENQRQPENKVNSCPMPMGISAENLLMNMHDSFKATGKSAAIHDKEIVTVACGSNINMFMDFGMVQLLVNEKMEVLTVGAGYRNGSNIAQNTDKAFSAIQALMSPLGRSKLGELEAGKKLFELTMDTILAAKNSGYAANEFTNGGNIYSVMVKDGMVSMMVQKQN